MTRLLYPAADPDAPRHRADLLAALDAHAAMLRRARLGQAPLVPDGPCQLVLCSDLSLVLGELAVLRRIVARVNGGHPRQLRPKIQAAIWRLSRACESNT